MRIASGDDRLEIRMDDKAKSIAISLKKAGGRVVDRAITLDDKGITLDAGTGDITIKGKNVNVDATFDAKINAKKNATVKGSMTDVSGTASAALHAPMVRIN